MRKSLIPAFIAVAVMGSSDVLAQTFTGLGTLPGDNVSIGLGISADGAVVVGASGSGGNYHHAFRWNSEEGMVSIGVGELFAFANAVSGDGQVIVGVGDPDGGGNSAFRWTNAGGMVRLSSLPGWGYSSAYSANSDGSVVSGYGISPDGKRAVRWTNAGTGGGTMENLGTLSTPDHCGAPPNFPAFSQGYGGVSADGSVISGDSSANVQYCSGHVFRWTSNGMGGGTMQDLGVLPGMYATDSLAFGLSADGTVVVGSSQADNADQAFRWTSATGMQDIGSLLTAGDEPSEADACNADGTAVVGYFSDASAGDLHAFLWTTTLGAVDLNDYLPTLGIDLTGWTLEFARGISANGMTIAGYGDHNGFNEAWIVTLGCAAPQIASQPSPASSCANGVAPFSVTATGDSLFYLWQIETSPGVWQGMGNDPFPLPCGGGAFAFASPINSPTVNIGVHPCPGGGVQTVGIRCVVSNSCGSATSDATTLTIYPSGTGDVNGDGLVNGRDVQGFVTVALSGGSASLAYCAADMNHDGAVNAADVPQFVSTLLGP